jgi:hypothetical protein
MSDDLVKRLRNRAESWLEYECEDDAKIDTEAADRIEKLEEALGALWWGVGENGAPDELLEKTKDALKGTKYE